jgi:hypothetical protein
MLSNGQLGRYTEREADLFLPSLNVADSQKSSRGNKRHCWLKNVEKIPCISLNSYTPFMVFQDIEHHFHHLSLSQRFTQWRIVPQQ